MKINELNPYLRNKFKTTVVPYAKKRAIHAAKTAARLTLNHAGNYAAKYAAERYNRSQFAHRTGIKTSPDQLKVLYKKFSK
jgi:hypothetical protein